MTYDYDDIKIDGDVTVNKLNSSIGKLVKNDVDMTFGHLSPTIWECNWYTVASENAQSYGYRKGSAVWMNTENIDEFVQNKKDEIYTYAMQYQPTRDKILQLSSDKQSLGDFYKSLVNGNNDFDKQHRYVFCIGELSDSVQIRISKKDNNTDPPTSDESWYNFIDRSIGEDVYKSIILSVLEQQQQEKMDEHLQKYHLSGLVGSGFKYENDEQFLQNYLDSDVGNLDQNSKFRSHKYTRQLSGFDYVVESQRIEYENGTVKWFKKWFSGMLEHGGMVNIEDSDPSSGDSLIYDGEFCKVRLDWKYGTKTAPIYDYPSNSTGRFYMRDDKIDTGFGNFQNYEKTEKQVGYQYRYQISLTPLIGEGGEDEIESPYYYSYDSSTPHYTTKEVTGMENDSFAFKYSENYTRYSYYIRGFVKNG